MSDKPRIRRIVTIETRAAPDATMTFSNAATGEEILTVPMPQQEPVIDERAELTDGSWVTR